MGSKSQTLATSHLPLYLGNFWGPRRASQIAKIAVISVRQVPGQPRPSLIVVQKGVRLVTCFRLVLPRKEATKLQERFLSPLALQATVAPEKLRQKGTVPCRRSWASLSVLKLYRPDCKRQCCSHRKSGGCSVPKYTAFYKPSPSTEGLAR